MTWWEILIVCLSAAGLAFFVIGMLGALRLSGEISEDERKEGK